MARKPYQPPEQSKLGQLVDALFLLGLVVVALYVPLWLQLAGGGKTALTFTDPSTWTGLGQNATQQAAWEKLGYTPETAAEVIASRFDYSFSWGLLALTAAVIIAYFVFLFRFSDKEYREVIAERFDDK